MRDIIVVTGIGLLVVGLLALVVFAAHADAEAWREYRERNECVLVSHTEPRQISGYTFGKNGGYTESTIAGQDCYECEHGPRTVCR